MQTVLTSVFTLSLLVLAGFVIGRRGILSASRASELSGFIVKVLLPVSVFNSMQLKYDPALVHQGMQIFGLAILMHGLFLGTGFLAVRLFRVPVQEKGVWLFLCLFSNNGFMGFPLAISLYGNEGLFLMSIVNMVSNFLIFSVGVWLLTRGFDVRTHISLKQMVVNNINLAVVLGLIFYFTQWPLPEIVTRTLTHVGNATAAMSMMVVGLSMSRLEVRRMFHGWRPHVLAGLRLLVLPLILLGVARLCGAPVQSTLCGVLFLSAALPSASSVTFITEQYNTNTRLASRMIFLTTLYSVATMPLFLMLVRG